MSPFAKSSKMLTKYGMQDFHSWIENIASNQNAVAENPQQAAEKFLQKLQSKDEELRQRFNRKGSDLIRLFCDHIYKHAKLGPFEEFDKQVIKIICSRLGLTPFFPPPEISFDELRNLLKKYGQSHKIVQIAEKVNPMHREEDEPWFWFYGSQGCFISHGNNCMLTPEFFPTRKDPNGKDPSYGR